MVIVMMMMVIDNDDDEEEKEGDKRDGYMCYLLIYSSCQLIS